MIAPKALLSLYHAALKKSFEHLVRNWLLLPLSVAAYLVYQLALAFLAPLGFGGGLLLGLVSLLLLTLYYGWLRAAANNERLRRGAILTFDYPLFSAILSVAFLLFPLSLIVHALIQSNDMVAFGMCLNLAIIILFNPVPEMVYRGEREGLEALAESYRFVLENWLEWFIPLVVVGTPILESRKINHV